MALEEILVYRIIAGDDTYPHSGTFMIEEAGQVTIDDSDGRDDALFGDFTHTGRRDVKDQDVTESTVSGINIGDTIDLRYQYSFTGSDGSSGNVFFIATNNTDNYGPLLVSDAPLTHGVTYSFGTFNTDGATLYGTLFICFAAGTAIATAKGEVVVEDLCRGDRVMTMDNGLQQVRWIGRRDLDRIDLAHAPSLRPIRIAAGALGEGTPSRTLRVSPQHRILIRSAVAERMFGTCEVLVAAKRLLGLPGVSVETGTEGVTYVHFLFDHHQLVLSNGAITESLFTGPEALRAVSPVARAEILALFPDLANDDHPAYMARAEVKQGRRIDRMIQRHVANGKAVQGARVL